MKHGMQNTDQVLIGTVSDASNVQTKGLLNQSQEDFLSHLSSSIHFQPVRQTSSQQEDALSLEGLGGLKVTALALELLARRENQKHNSHLEKMSAVQNKVGFVAAAKTYLAPTVKFLSPEYRRRLSRLKAVETVVSDKHIFLWASLLESPAIGALIFEADFTPGPKTNWGLLPTLVNSHCREYDFMDFSASFSFEKLGLPNSDRDLTLDFLTTNTLCAYWISRKAAAAALTHVGRKPWLRAIGADFLLNSVNNRPGPWRSYLVRDPVVGHLSMKDRSKTTIGTM